MRRRDFIAAIGGAGIAWPLAARAQQRAVPVSGFLSAATRDIDEPGLAAAFRRGLGKQGFFEGRNIQILYRWAETQYDRLPAVAAELVRRQVSAIFAASTQAASAAKSQTATIPIVFWLGGDPVSLGLVPSLNRPGGNITGVTIRTTELVAKRLELQHEIVPTVASIGFLVNPTGAETGAEINEAETAARILGVQLVLLNATGPEEIEAAFKTLAAQRIGALLLAFNAVLAIHGELIIALAARYAIPTMPVIRDDVAAGGLITYGSSFPDAWRIVGTYVGRVLKGDKPSDLPVQQSTRIDMALNLKTAKALGIEVPTATLLRATEVIE